MKCGIINFIFEIIVVVKFPIAFVKCTIATHQKFMQLVTRKNKALINFLSEI